MCRSAGGIPCLIFSGRVFSDREELEFRIQNYLSVFGFEQSDPADGVSAG